MGMDLFLESWLAETISQGSPHLFAVTLGLIGLPLSVTVVEDQPRGLVGNLGGSSGEVDRHRLQILGQIAIQEQLAEHPLTTFQCR